MTCSARGDAINHAGLLAHKHREADVGGVEERVHDDGDADAFGTLKGDAKADAESKERKDCVPRHTCAADAVHEGEGDRCKKDGDPRRVKDSQEHGLQHASVDDFFQDRHDEDGGRDHHPGPHVVGIVVEHLKCLVADGVDGIAKAGVDECAEDADEADDGEYQKRAENALDEAA